jgi:hypothetical protein
MKNKVPFVTEAHECMCISDMSMQQDAEIKYYFQFFFFESRLKLYLGTTLTIQNYVQEYIFLQTCAWSLLSHSIPIAHAWERGSEENIGPKWRNEVSK